MSKKSKNKKSRKKDSSSDDEVEILDKELGEDSMECGTFRCGLYHMPNDGR